jgi:hypothetical protein
MEDSNLHRLGTAIFLSYVVWREKSSLLSQCAHLIPAINRRFDAESDIGKYHIRSVESFRSVIDQAAEKTN